MKKAALLLVLSVILFNCNKEPEGQVIKGDFVYLADAAVLQTADSIYGVVINKKMHELDDMVKQYKKEDTDMVPVEIKGIITPKPENEEGWEYRVEITEILNVSAPNPNDNTVIKIGKQE